MRKDMVTIHQIDRSAIVKSIQAGTQKGMYYVESKLIIPPHNVGEAPVAATVVGAIQALWQWIEAVPKGKWITLSGQPERRSDAYRWSDDSGWVKRAR